MFATLKQYKDSSESIKLVKNGRKLVVSFLLICSISLNNNCMTKPFISHVLCAIQISRQLPWALKVQPAW